MKFDELDARMRVFETSRDPAALPDTFLVARIDGRSFTRLTGELMQFDKPYDERFRDHMIATVHHLIECGFQARFGYTQSDEISLLFDPSADAFGRSIRKWTSILAGEASGAFSLRLGRPAAFDCRIIELPTLQHVVDYFRWRSEDAHRNALNGWCYWTLRSEGATTAAATGRLSGLTIAQKNELLFQRGRNFNDLPAWQRRGVGVVHELYERPGTNPLTGETVTTQRRRLRTVLELPMRDEFDVFVRQLMAQAL